MASSSHQRAANEAAGDWYVLLALAVPIIGATFLSKLAIPYLKSDGIGMGFPMIYLSLLLGMFAVGRIRLDSSRLLFFCVMASVLGGVMVLRGEVISLPSLAFLLLLHLPYVAYFTANDRIVALLLRVFLNVATFIALCGLAQYVLQFFIAKAYVFPMENFLPAEWLATGFNMQAPIAYGSEIYRPNGIFMPEPSFFSQLLAIAALVEMMGSKRLWRIGLFIVAIVASQSGTGLVLLAIGIPVLIVAHRRWSLIAVVAVLATVLLVLSPWLHLDRLIARVGEFGSEQSSAYARFIGGFYIFDASVGADPLRALFGFGAGTYRDIANTFNRPAAEMTLFKIVVEYGLVGTVLYFGFLFFCIFRSQGPLALRVVLAASLFLNGAYHTFVHSLVLALLVWPSVRKDEGRDTLATEKSAPLDEHRLPAVARSVC